MTTNLYLVENRRSALSLGLYRAQDEESALKAMYREAQATPPPDPCECLDELIVSEVEVRKCDCPGGGHKRGWIYKLHQPGKMIPDDTSCRHFRRRKDALAVACGETAYWEVEEV